MEENFDNLQVEETEEINQLLVTENMRSYFYDMAKWANFLGILGFVFSGLMLLMALSAGALTSVMGAMSNAGMYGQLGTGVLTTVFVFYAVMFLYPSLMLFLYAKKAKQGVLYGDQNSLEESISKLKSFFKFYGVLAIIFICFYGFVFIGAIIGGIAAS